MTAREIEQFVLTEAASWLRSTVSDGCYEDDSVEFDSPADGPIVRAALLGFAADLLKKAGVRACRVCACTDDDGCEGGCFWSLTGEDLCSRCETEERRPALVVATR